MAVWAVAQNLGYVLILPEFTDCEQFGLVGSLSRLFDEFPDEVLIDMLDRIKSKASDADLVDGPFTEGKEIGIHVRMVMVDVGTHWN